MSDVLIYGDRAGGADRTEALLEVTVRACRSLGLERATVPAEFPLDLADRLRADGIGLRAAAELLRRAQPNGNGLHVDGETLTCERVKEAIRAAVARHGASGGRS